MDLVVEPTFENAVLFNKDVCLLFAEYLTLRDFWVLCETNAECHEFFQRYAKVSGEMDTLDSFFDMKEFDNSEFLIWCKKNKILIKRMAILVSFSEDLLELHIALDSYLKEFGSSVVAVSFKFNYNCSHWMGVFYIFLLTDVG